MSEILDDEWIIQKEKKEPFLSKLYIICFGLCFIFGIVFKIMHWPLSGIMLLTGSSGLSGYLLARILFIRTLLQYRILAFIILISVGLYYIQITRFRLDNLIAYLMTSGILFGINTLRIFLMKQINKSKPKNNN